MASRSIGWSPSRRNVVASFRDMKRARAAIDALEARGFDAGSISLEGSRALRAAEREDTRRRDRRMSSFVGAHVVVGIAIGGVIAMGIGILIVALSASASPTALLLAAIAGGVGGGSIGMMIGGVGSIDVTPDWELTFERDRDGRVLVAVGSEDPEKARDAVEVLDELEPISIGQVDASGRPL